MSMESITPQEVLQVATTMERKKRKKLINLVDFILI
jgi:hypothetical protein